MIARALALTLLLSAGGAGACPAPQPGLLFHSCWGSARAALRLLPEAPPEPAALTVTGAYTGTDSRDGDLPNPVGLFVAGGAVVNPTLAPMDGILVIDGAGRLTLNHRREVPLGERVFDLRATDERRLFAQAAAKSGLSVMQSHLLIDAGRLDLRPVEGAPAARRRILFTDAYGYGVWQSAAALTLYEATRRLAAAHAPDRALNLDMGSFDYCLRAADGETAPCGLRAAEDFDRLSNLLQFSFD